MPNAHTSVLSAIISSNTLFHFTRYIANIRGILQGGFKPNLSLEDLSCLGLDYKVTIPMVSFCDIPLSQTKAHMQYYGYYGIGLSKSWGQKNGISPVLYTYKGSPLTSSLTQSLSWIHTKYLEIEETDGVPQEAWALLASIQRADKKDTTPSDQYIELWDRLLKIQCLIKPYEGPFRKGNQSFPNVRFYDEREWRFVPELGRDLINYLLDENEYNKIAVRKKAANEIQKRSVLSFEPTDIKYIIIHRNEEILPMIKKIEDIKGDRYTQNEIKLLCSKIISAGQIATDF